MTVVLVGAVGFFLALVAHDLAIQSLDANTRLVPFAGTCPNCGHQRGWLGVKCPECGRLAIREMLFAVVVALGAIGFQNTTGLEWLLVPYLGFLTLTAALMITDIEEFRIVDRLNLWGTAVLTIGLALVSLLIGESSDLWRGLSGGAIYFAGASLLFIVARGQGFGAGDVKLSFQLGLFTSYIDWITLGRAVFVTAMLGGVLALVLVVFGNAGRKSELPYGPPMVLGAWTAIVMAGLGVGPLGP